MATNGGSPILDAHGSPIVDADRAREVGDSFTNFLQGLGGPADKIMAQQYAWRPMSTLELETAYRANWMARKVVDIPAYDATREWRRWQADNSQIEKLEQHEKRLRYQQKMAKALVKARLYGGAAIVIGIKNEKSPQDELRPESVKQDDLQYIHVLSMHEIKAGEINRNVLDPLYGEPINYTVTTTDTHLQQVVHPSRVVRIVGNPHTFKEESSAWGDSVLQVVDEAIRSCGLVTDGVAHMVAEAKIDVVKIPGLTANITTDTFKRKLTERFAYANARKSILNMLIMDGQEEWQRVSSNFSSLPDVLSMYLLIASGAADIPATRMLGQSAVGLNATGEGDLQNYYDRVRTTQVNELQPALERLDEVLIRSALGSRPKSLHYDWRPLWQMSDAQEADLAKKKAEVFKIDADVGLIPEIVLGKVRINQLIEDGVYPGLEQEMEKAGDIEEALNEQAMRGIEKQVESMKAMSAAAPPAKREGEEDEEEEEGPPHRAPPKRKKKTK